MKAEKTELSFLPPPSMGAQISFLKEMKNLPDKPVKLNLERPEFVEPKEIA